MRFGPEPRMMTRGRSDGTDLVLVLPGRVVVRREGGELGGAGVDGLVRRQDAGGLPCGAHRGDIGAPQVGELGVAEPELLRSAPRPRLHAVCATDIVECLPLLDDPGDLVEEPLVDAARGVNLLDGHPSPDQLGNLEDPLRRRRSEGAEQPGRRLSGELILGRVGVETESALLQRAEGLLQTLGKRPADRHHLADRLHLCPEHPTGTGELLECPARHLGDDVVDRRFEARRRLAGDVVGDLVERVADGELGSDLGDRKSGRLGRQRRRSRDPWVHLDDHLAPGGRIEGELHVRSTRLHADASDAGERGVAHLLVFDVAERLRRGDGDRIAGVHAHRIDVLDRADDHAVVGVITHHLELELLPAGDRLLDEDLADRARRQPGVGEPAELLRVRGDTRAPPAEDVRRADDHRQPDDPDDLHASSSEWAMPDAWYVEADADHRRLELTAILGGGDRRGVGSEHLGSPRHTDRRPSGAGPWRGSARSGRPASGARHRAARGR